MRTSGGGNPVGENEILLGKQKAQQLFGEASTVLWRAVPRVEELNAFLAFLKERF